MNATAREAQSPGAMNAGRRRALSRWRRRRRLGRRLGIAELALEWPWAWIASAFIDQRLVAFEDAA
jgi:hypothetical protein